MDFETEGKFIELQALYETLHNALHFSVGNKDNPDAGHLICLSDIILKKFEAFDY